MSHGKNRWKFLRCTVFLATMALFLGSAIPALTYAQEKTLLASLFGSSSGGPAPDFELKDLSGDSVRLSTFKGQRPVLLYFWATWCPYCIAAKPEVAKLRENVGRSELEILAINVGAGDTLEKLRKYQDAHPVKYPVLYDGGGKVTESYHVQGIPLFVLVDKQGNVAYRGGSVPDPARYLK